MKRAILFKIMLSIMVLAITSGCNAFAEHELDVDREITEKLSRNLGYQEAYEGQLVEELSRTLEEMPEVEDVRIIISGPTLIIGVLTYEKKEAKVISAVRQKVVEQTNEQDIRIIMDDETFSQTEKVKDEIEEIISPNPVRGNRTNYLEP